MIEAHLLKKLNEIERNFHAVSSKLENPSAIDLSELHQLFKSFAEVEQIVELFGAWKKLGADLAETQQIIQESTIDLELQELATREVAELDRQIINLEYQLKVLLLPKDPDDEKNVFLEIKADTVDTEAEIWAEDLVRMYEHFARNQGWNVRLVCGYDGEMGGFKVAFLEIKGNRVHGRVYSQLKFESGIHKVYRLPIQEPKLKLHAVTATVTVMLEVDIWAVGVPICDLELYIHDRHYCGGPKPKPHHGITVYHHPTMNLISCFIENNQRLNKELAIQILMSKLHSIELQKQQEYLNCSPQDIVCLDTDLLPLITNDLRKIRDYNYADNSIVDRRLDRQFDLAEVMSGGMDEIIQGCLDRDMQSRLVELVRDAPQ